MKSSFVALAGVAILVAAFSSSSLAASATRLPGFRSPTGNIKCFVVPGSRNGSGRGHSPSTLRCELGHADYAAALQARCIGPTGAGVDWHGFELSAKGKGQVTCSGGILYNPGTQHPSYVTLPYGKSWRQGVFTCVSRITGVTCRNREGNGLFVSRQAWRTW